MTIIYVILIQITLGLLGIGIGYSIPGIVLHENRKTISAVIGSMVLFNLILFLGCLYLESWIGLVCFILNALAWNWWFQKIHITIQNGYLFTPYQNYKEQLIRDKNGNVVELVAGKQILLWPWFRLQKKEHHSEEVIPGFDAKNNIIRIPEIATTTNNPIIVPSKDVEAELIVNQEKAYQLDLFEYEGRTGQAAAVHFTTSRIIDVLKHFVSRFSLEQIKTAELVRVQLEDNGNHTKIIEAVNKQLYEFTIKNIEEGDNGEKVIREEPFEAYMIKKIKIGEIVMPEAYLTGKEFEAIIDNIMAEYKDGNGSYTIDRAEAEKKYYKRKGIVKVTELSISNPENIPVIINQNPN